MNSSAPHQAKRSLLVVFIFAICSATSRMVAEPLPLSLMPGPSVTESRWAPTITTLSGSPPLDSAKTFWVVRTSDERP